MKVMLMGMITRCKPLLFTGLLLAVLAITLGARSGAETARAASSINLKCGGWHSPHASSVTSNNGLQSVTALSANDVWAVGSKNAGTLTEHWNGSHWTVVPSPSQGPTSALKGIAAVAKHNIWAVGSVNGSNGAKDSALIEHWNGSKWSIVSNPATNHSGLTSVAAFAANDVWAVGGTLGSNGTMRGLVEHWNGSKWSIMSTPATAGDNSFLVSIDGSSAHDIWAVGTRFNFSSWGQSLMMHWNGAHWKVINGPSLNAQLTLLNSVTVIAKNNVWAVGSIFSISDLAVKTLVMHWNGSHWSMVSSPSISGSFSSMLTGVTASSANNIWAVGTHMSGLLFQTLIEHWDGAHWSVVSSPNPGAGEHLLVSVVAVPGSGQVWSVGASGIFSGHIAPMIITNC